MRSRSRHLLAAAGCLLATALAAPGGALAAFPGADGSIAFTADAPGGGEAIFSVNSKGKQRRQLTVPDGLVDTDPAWSGDGTQLAFTRILSGTESRLMLTSAFGAGARTLTPEGSALIESEPTFSPDGARIAFRGRPSGSSFLSGDDEIYSIALDGTGLVALTDTPGVAVQEPAWSPDGRKIAYSRALGGGAALGPSDIFTLDLLSGTSTLVTTKRPNADDDDASWRPDGKRLVYERERSKGPDDMALIRPNGQDSRLLLRAPEGAEYRDPGYSPSGEKVALYMNRGSKAGIGIYDVAKKKLRFLVSASQNESDWQPIDD